MMEWLFWTIILSTSLYGLEQNIQPGSPWGCNSNKASLITKWQYCGEIRNLRNTNPGVLLLFSRGLVIAINWDGPPPHPLPPGSDLGKKSQLTQPWVEESLLVLFLVDRIHHIIVGIDFLSWLHWAPTYSGNKLSTSNLVPSFKLGNHQGRMPVKDGIYRLSVLYI